MQPVILDGWMWFVPGRVRFPRVPRTMINKHIAVLLRLSGIGSERLCRKRRGRGLFSGSYGGLLAALPREQGMFEETLDARDKAIAIAVAVAVAVAVFVVHKLRAALLSGIGSERLCRKRRGRGLLSGSCGGFLASLPREQGMFKETLDAQAKAIVIAVAVFVVHKLRVALLLLLLLPLAALLDPGCPVGGSRGGWCLWHGVERYVDHFIVHDALGPHSGWGNVECPFDGGGGRGWKIYLHCLFICTIRLCLVSAVATVSNIFDCTRE